MCEASHTKDITEAIKDSGNKNCEQARVWKVSRMGEKERFFKINLC